MTIEEYFNAAHHHDWYSDYSDDHSVWSRGNANLARLQTEAMADPIKQQILDGWKAWHFTGSPWNTEKAPQPDLSTYLGQS